LKLEYLNTIQAPKTIVLPQKETFLEFKVSDDGSPELKESLPEESTWVVFGVRPCDARALTLTDKVFGGEFKDPYYWARRNQTIIIGLACNTAPSPNCFCLTVDGSPHSRDGMDISLTDLGDRYFVQSLTEKGEKLIKASSKYFEQAQTEDKKNRDNIKKLSEKSIARHVENLKEVPAKLRSMFDSSLWEEESMSCLRCGICTYLCPTCHCFDICDELTTSSPAAGKRIRNWDTCQFPDFTMHSSGHNPRPDKASRLRQRIMHKFNYFVETYQNYQCTGCGRCTSLCPVGIDIIEVLSKVREHE
jgi:sulfhydrogenase subunit beta (sulfur reductase)